MVKRIGTFRSKSRHKMRKNVRQKGKLSVNKYFQKFEDGEKVVLKAEPAVQRGLYFLRFHGKVGVVSGKQGACYKVAITDFKKDKTLLVHPVHLKRV